MPEIHVLICKDKKVMQKIKSLMYERPAGTPGNVGSRIVPAKHTMLEQLYISTDNFSCIYK